VIVTRTPLRISLAGGGTDMAAFYHHQEFGAVVSVAINKYIYVSVNESFNGMTRASYSRQEVEEDPINLKHELIRGALGYFDVKGVEVTSVSDIPGEGSGLGSSSAFMVGLALALAKYTRRPVNQHPASFADLAYDLEKGRCKHTVGKQDHFAAAYGGLYYYQFNADETTATKPIFMEEMHKRRMEKELMLFWTGETREAGPILADQWERLRNDPRIWTAGRRMRDMAVQLGTELEHGNVDAIGPLLSEGWQQKKKLSHGISNPQIDEWLAKAIQAGASGGKLCGAGGGGFLLIAAKPERQWDVEKALKLRRVIWRMALEGSSIVYKDGG